MGLPYFLDPFGVGKKSIPRYGFRIDESNPSPEIERIYDSVGMVANVGTSLVDNPRNDFDGVFPFNSITKETIAGNVMVKIPKFYISRKRYEDGGKWYFEVAICETKFDETYVPHEMFLRGNIQFSENNPESDYNDYTYVSAYKQTHDKQAISGYNPQVQRFRSGQRESARSIGDGWSIMDVVTQNGLWLLYHIVFANRDSQSIMPGNTSGAVKPTGQTDGAVATCVQLGNLAMSFYGVEDIYSNVAEFIDGINIITTQAYICTKIPDYADSTEQEPPNENYRLVGYSIPMTDGYISKIGFDANNPFAMFPTEMNGSESTYYCDYATRATYYWRTLIVGGYFADDPQNGISRWLGVNVPTFGNAQVGTRFIYRPF